MDADSGKSTSYLIFFGETVKCNNQQSKLIQFIHFNNEIFDENNHFYNQPDIFTLSTGTNEAIEK